MRQSADHEGTARGRRGSMADADTIETSERFPHAGHARVNHGLLAEPERRALRWLAERTPAWIVPDHLTALGVAGAMLVAAGFVGTRFSVAFVGLAIFGLFLNWYGDSLDGTLARYRRIERPRYGYFLDHSCDLVSQMLMFAGLGLSPYFTLFSALLALSMYLLMSSYTYLKVMIFRTHQLSYGGMGATELRLAIAGWSVLAIWVGPVLTHARFRDVLVIDAVTAGLAVLVFVAFVWMVKTDLDKFRHIVDRHGDERERKAVPGGPLRDTTADPRIVSLQATAGPKKHP